MCIERPEVDSDTIQCNMGQTRGAAYPYPVALTNVMLFSVYQYLFLAHFSLFSRLLCFFDLILAFFLCTLVKVLKHFQPEIWLDVKSVIKQNL